MDDSVKGEEVQTENLKVIQWQVQPLSGLHEYHNGGGNIFCEYSSQSGLLSPSSRPVIDLREKLSAISRETYLARGNWFNIHNRISFHRL